MSPERSPDLSVLLPVRDAEAVLEAALESLTRQTFPSFEVIAVDDGSTDGSLAILERHAEKDPRFRVISQAALGIVAALEKARREARAPLLARMDADDIAHPERFEAQVEHMGREPRLAACGSHVRYFPEATVRGGARRYEGWLNSFTSSEEIERDLFVECPLAHPSLLLDADAVSRVGGYRSSGWSEDYDLLLRLWEGGLRLGVVPRTLLYWREGPARLSRNHDDYSPAAFRRVKLHFLRRTLLRGRTGLVVWGAGPTGKSFAREAIRQGVTLLAFVDLDPRKIGQDIHGAPVIAPHDLERVRGALCVAAVGRNGVREEIRSTLRAAGWQDGKGFIAVA